MPRRPLTKKRDSASSYAVILAGGSGTRFWPAGRRLYPKQFLSLVGKESLLQNTLKRLKPLFPRNNIYVVGNAEHKALLRKQLPGLGPKQILLEPVGRNTAAAIALAAKHIRHRIGASSNALIAVFPADHIISNQTAFRSVARRALQAAAQEDTMVVLGVPPTFPQTGYGYIERGSSEAGKFGTTVYSVRRFTEKPSPRTAARFLRSKRYYWNAGMFFWRLSALEDMFKAHLSTHWNILDRLQPHIARRSYESTLRKLYPKLKDISVDYALAEPLASQGHVKMFPADIGWSDLGTWSAFYDWMESKGSPDAFGNILPGNSFSLDASGNLIHSDNQYLAVIGVEDLIVVSTKDALLICPRARSQDVGTVVKHLKKTKNNDLL
jgi:mannose-1-phosphate guanylyltransferase